MFDNKIWCHRALGVAGVSTILALDVTGTLAGTATNDFRSFKTEVERVTTALNCPRPKLTPGYSMFGALYGCVIGRAQTVKVFINEQRGSGEVANVKLMWNDWYKDAGYGLHADRAEARRVAGVIIGLYGSKIKDQLMTALFSNENVTLKAEPFRFVYTYKRGPKIDERLLVVVVQ
jgi:hypothetical protein